MLFLTKAHESLCLVNLGMATGVRLILLLHELILDSALLDFGVARLQEFLDVSLRRLSPLSLLVRLRVLIR